MSKKTLFIIESGGKVKKLNELLGKEFIVKPTMGHIMDLPKDSLGIDVTNNFEANYITNPDKKQLVKELKKCAEECDDIMLCSDMDREGEMISQNVKDILKLKKYKRVVFNEITKKAIEEAIKGAIKEAIKEAIKGAIKEAVSHLGDAIKEADDAGTPNAGTMEPVEGASLSATVASFFAASTSSSSSHFRRSFQSASAAAALAGQAVLDSVRSVS
jgi:5S rRNA maturation endonuclease (ribonuclease M5)